LSRRARKEKKIKMEKAKIMSNHINGVKMWRVYRLKNSDEPMHSGNIEYLTGYLAAREEAEAELEEYI
jgi:hypothetical protein